MFTLPNELQQFRRRLHTVENLLEPLQMAHDIPDELTLFSHVLYYVRKSITKKIKGPRDFLEQISVLFCFNTPVTPQV